MGEQSGFQFFPEAASTIAGSVDGLYAYLVIVSAFFTLLVAFLVVFFSIKYRKKDDSIPKPVDEHSIGGMLLEITWSVIPLGLSLIMFAWGANIFFIESRPPADSLEVFVTGKQWMWKIQHNEGAREINELHVPVNKVVRIDLTSKDVIHSFFVPNLRLKQDAVPGRIIHVWFEATETGQYEIPCAELCGFGHSGMLGNLTVQSQEDYDKWLKDKYSENK